MKYLSRNQARTSAPVSGWHGRVFAASMLAFVVIFVIGLAGILVADIMYIDAAAIKEVIHSRDIRAALSLSLWTSGITVVLGMLLAVPMGYALSRYRFPGHALVDSLVDLPIILPPLVAGLSLLVFFQTAVGRFIEDSIMRFVYEPRGIILCQLFVSASFGIRAVKLTFDGIDPRVEHVAMTLGSTPAGAFFRVALPMARRGILVGAILVWARAFGIYGPLMVVVGTVRRQTEVLPTTIYLEQSVGHIETALAVAMLMLLLAVVALVTFRTFGLRSESDRHGGVGPR